MADAVRPVGAVCYLLEHAGDPVPIAISLLSGSLCLGYLAAVSAFLAAGTSGRGEARPAVAVPFPAGASPSKSIAAEGRAGWMSITMARCTPDCAAGSPRLTCCGGS